MEAQCGAQHGRTMEWSNIRIEASAQSGTGEQPSRPGYVLCLPLIADGRIALSLFRRQPDRATVARCGMQAPDIAGMIVYRDNQWTCVWNPLHGQDLPEVRVIGSRFSVGDLVGMRPFGRQMELFRVFETQPAD